MNGLKKYYIWILISLFSVLVGCQPASTDGPIRGPAASEKAVLETEPDTRTVGDVGGIAGFGPSQLQGFGLVTGLSNTGSKDCPPAIRDYLTGYMKTQLPPDSKVSPTQLLNNPDTSVVSILGLLPAGAVKNEKFDLIVSSIKATETVSLAGGRLLPSELKYQTAGVGQTLPLARAEGAVFLPSQDNPLFGYILNGGSVINTQKIVFKMNEGNFSLISVVRDVINAKFGSRTAVAVNKNIINLTIPPDYVERKLDFLNLVQSLPLFQEVAKDTLIKELISELKTAQGGKFERLQYRLKAIGKPVARQLISLLDSKDPKIRLAAAEILLFVGNYEGFQPLTEFAFNGTLEQKLVAVESLAFDARRKDVTGVLTRLLGDEHLEVKLKAYEHLRRFNDLAIAENKVETSSGVFELSRIVQSDEPIVWGARSGAPRIALFGSPIYCKDDIFVDDGELMINSLPGTKSVTLVKKVSETGKIIKINCSNELGAVITRLCQVSGTKRVNGNELVKTGLGVSYSRMLKFVEKMHLKGAFDADFYLGAEPNIRKAVNIE